VIIAAKKDGSNSPRNHASAPQLPEAAELHLLEAVSIVTRPRGVAVLLPIDENKPMLQQVTEGVGALFGASKDGAGKDNVNATTAAMDGVSSEMAAQLSDEQRERMRCSHQDQLGALQQFVTAITEQAEALVAMLQAGQQLVAQNEEELANALAHKVSCLAALAKSNGASCREERIAIILPAARYIVGICAQLAHFSVIRAKAVMLLHRMVISLGPHSIELFGHTYQFLLRHGEATDTDQIVQVLNQIMAEFQSKGLLLVDSALAPTLEKMQHLIATFESTQQENKWAAERSSAATLHTLGLSPTSSLELKEAPHVDLERAALQRQYLEFLRHVSQHGCHEALMSASNRHMLEHVLRQILKGLGGSGAGLVLPLPGSGGGNGSNGQSSDNNGSSSSNGSGSGGGERLLESLETGAAAMYNSGVSPAVVAPPRVGASTGYALRRISLNVLIGLSKAWLTASMRNNGVPDSSSPEGGDDATHLPIDPSAAAGMAQAFRQYMLDQVLPLCLGGFTSGVVSLDHAAAGGGRSDGNTSTAESVASGQQGDSHGPYWTRIDLSDAQAMGAIADLASLLCSLTQLLGREEMAGYLQHVLPRLGWGQQASQGVMQLVLTNTQQLAFRDGFKKIVRNFRS
jgi:hypothetical protein